jgi:hypothetical protein
MGEVLVVLAEGRQIAWKQFSSVQGSEVRTAYSPRPEDEITNSSLDTV